MNYSIISFANNLRNMTNNRTFTMIKPDGVEAGHIGAILDKICAAGFKIVAMKYTKLSIDKAKEFYAVHSERPFYGELVEMSRLIILLKKMWKCSQNSSSLIFEDLGYLHVHLFAHKLFNYVLE